MRYSSGYCISAEDSLGKTFPHFSSIGIRFSWSSLLSFSTPTVCPHPLIDRINLFELRNEIESTLLIRPYSWFILIGNIRVQIYENMKICLKAYIIYTSIHMDFGIVCIGIVELFIWYQLSIIQHQLQFHFSFF